jgi:L-fuconolactonase
VRVDAHCHVSDVWYEPAETLLFQMDRHGIDVAIITQMLGQFDNSYQARCQAQWPDRFVSIGGVDVATADWQEELDKLAASGAWGVRLRPVTGPGEAEATEVWSHAQALGLAISCIATMEQLASETVNRLLTVSTQAPVLLEHGAGLGRADQVDDGAVVERIASLGTAPHLFLKLPSLGQVEQRARRFSSDTRPLVAGAGFQRLRRLVTALGCGRTMWGSDFPVVSTREGYANALGWTEAAFAAFSDSERAQLFGGTAARLIGNIT